MNTVPFSLGNLYAGFGECEGMLHDEGEYLAFEFQVKDSVAGIFKSGIRKVRVPLKDLVSVTLSKGWFGTTWTGVTIVLQAARLETFQEIPGASHGKIELAIARKDRDAAERLVAGLHEPDESGEPTA